MKSQSHEKGSAFAIIIIVLAVAIVGVLGFVFWQNFINKPVTPAALTTQSTKDDTELTQTATASYGNTNMTLKYPKNWKLASDNNTLTSADGKVTLFYTLTPLGEIGGTCGDAADANPVVDPVLSAKWAAIPGVPKAIFSSHISRNRDGSHYFDFGAATNTDEIKNVQVGTSSCVPFMFASYINLDLASGAYLQAKVTFTDLLAANGSLKLDLTESEIKTQFASANADVAEAIIESIVIK